MSASLALRPLGPADSALLAALHAACFEAEPWDETACAGLLATPGGFGLLAARGPAPLGFLLARVAAEECEILSIGVVPAARRGGTGRVLLAAALERAAAAGAVRALLEVAADDPAALGLYRAAGFEACGRRRGYYRRAAGPAADALILARDLAAGGAKPQ